MSIKDAWIDVFVIPDKLLLHSSFTWRSTRQGRHFPLRLRRLLEVIIREIFGALGCLSLTIWIIISVSPWFLLLMVMMDMTGSCALRKKTAQYVDPSLWSNESMEGSRLLCNFPGFLMCGNEIGPPAATPIPFHSHVAWIHSSFILFTLWKKWKNSLKCLLSFMHF